MDRTPRCVIHSSRIVQSGPSGWFETASIVDRRQLSSEMPREHKSIFKNVIFEGLEILPELSVDHSHIFARRTAQSEIQLTGRDSILFLMVISEVWSGNSDNSLSWTVREIKVVLLKQINRHQSIVYLVNCEPCTSCAVSARRDAKILYSSNSDNQTQDLLVNSHFPFLFIPYGQITQAAVLSVFILVCTKCAQFTAIFSYWVTD